jgi:hypothetical protein
MVSEGLDRHLGLSERARLKLHLSMCQSCTNFDQQMHFLRKAMRNYPLDESNSDEDLLK